MLCSSNSQSAIIGWFSSYFLKSLITDLMKPIRYPVSKYFFVMIETFASQSEAIFKVQYKSLYL